MVYVLWNSSGLTPERIRLVLVKIAPYTCLNMTIFPAPHSTSLSFLFPIQIPVVRAHAASALEFLQDPSPQCPVTSALLSLMEKDSSPEVRRAILNKIAVSNRTLSGESHLSVPYMYIEYF